MNKLLLQDAVDFHKKNQFKKALKIYKTLLLEYPDDLELIFLIGTLFIQTKEYSESIKQFHKIVAKNPKNYHVLSNLGIAYMENNDFNNAEKYFKESIQINYNFSHSHNNLGNLYFKLKDYKSAIAYYSNALKIESSNEFYINRARAFIKSNAFFEAEEDLKKIPSKFKSLELYLLQIELLNHFNKYSEIINLLSSMDSLIRDTEIIKIKEIDTLFHLKTYEDITLLIEKLSKINSKHFYRGLLFYKKNNFDDAIREFEHLINDTNYDYLAFNNLGLIKMDTGDFNSALDYFSKALVINPEFKEAKLNIGIIKLFNKNFLDGWPLYFYRQKDVPKILPPHLFEYKDLTIPNNKTLIIAEQGIGDHVFYLQILKATLPYQYDFLIDERLVSLYSYLHRNNNIFSLNDSSINFNKYDSYIFIADLFKYFISSISDISIFKTKYHLSQNIINTSKSKHTIGISWKTFSNDTSSKHEKSFNLSFFIDNIKKNFKNFNLVNLQYGDISHDMNSISSEDRSLFLSHEIDLKNDINSLFYLINQCDSIITIGNLTAHISGTLEKPTFVLVPKKFQRLWYWHTDEINIWYKNMKLFFLESSSDSNLILK